MTTEQFITNHQELIERKRVHDEMLNQKYNDYLKAFIEANSSMQYDKVYELTNNVFKSPRGCKRFVVYDADVKWHDDKPVLVVGGWWLNNKTNIPQKWDCIPTFGVDNLPTVKLSDNQANELHPRYVEEQFER